MVEDPIGTVSQPETDHTTGSLDTCFFTGQGMPFGADGDTGALSVVEAAVDDLQVVSVTCGQRARTSKAKKPAVPLQ